MESIAASCIRIGASRWTTTTTGCHSARSARRIKKRPLTFSSSALGALALVLPALPALAQDVPLDARVTAVRDGDTLEVESGGRSFPLDLAEIDCPELDQTHGVEARRVAGELTAGARVRIGLREMPAGGRAVGSVRLPDGSDLAAELLRRGLAWFTGGDEGSAELRALERQARSARRGLWADDDPEPPWEARDEPAPPGLRRRVEALRAAPEPPRDPPPRGSGCIPRSRCCRVCSKGKACGNSCIQARLSCHKGRGCACDSFEVCR